MSTLSVDIIQGQTSAANVKMPAGHVIQLQSDILTTNFASSTSSTAWEDTPLSVTITPKYNTSKILITGMINYSGESGDHIDLKVVRNNADILLSTESAGNRIKSHIHHYTGTNDDVYKINNGVIYLLDSPGTTNALTYKLQGRTAYSAGYQFLLNHVATDADAAYNGYTVSTLQCMEIAQ
tara:strand:- start:602 stop:1144 length:543 start_codon:yes stop_codon:yes gene_type:complete